MPKPVWSIFGIENKHLIKTTNMMNGFNANMLKPDGFYFYSNLTCLY